MTISDVETPRGGAIQVATTPRFSSRAHRLVGLVVLALGGLLMLLSFRLGLGSLSRPDPGLWPFFASLVMAIAGIALAVTKGSPDEYEPFTRRTGLVLVGLASLALYIVAFERLGFFIPSFVLLLFWLRFMAREPWRVTVVVALLITVGCYALFDSALSVPFPDGPLGSVLPG